MLGAQKNRGQLTPVFAVRGCVRSNQNSPHRLLGRPALWPLAHAFLHEFAVTRLSVWHASFDGELLAFLEGGDRGSRGFLLSRRRWNGKANRQDGRDCHCREAHYFLLVLSVAPAARYLPDNLNAI